MPKPVTSVAKVCSNNSGKMPKKKGGTEWPWPWKPEEEATWGKLIISTYGEVTDLDRKYHATILNNYSIKLLNNEEFSLAMRRRLIMEPPTVSKEGEAKLAASIKEKTGVDYKRKSTPSEREQSKDTEAKSSSPSESENVSHEPRSRDTAETEKTDPSEGSEKTGSQKERRLVALRASRDAKPELTHKQRLKELQSTDPTLWGGVSMKAFKKLVQLDNRTPDEDCGIYRVPVRPEDAECRYPCQLCGEPLEAGNYERDNIQFCRPDGGSELKSLQWALDSDLYERASPKDGVKGDIIIACRNCTLPAPWGDGPSITKGSVSTDYENETRATSIDPLNQYMGNLALTGEYDECDERAMNYGFTDEETYELLCQGVKPWDDDAYDVLDVLHGDYDCY